MEYLRLYLKKGDGEEEDLAQQVKALVAKPGDRSLISRTNIIEGGPLTSTPALYYVHSNVSQQQEAVLERGSGLRVERWFCHLVVDNGQIPQQPRASLFL